MHLYRETWTHWTQPNIFWGCRVNSHSPLFLIFFCSPEKEVGLFPNNYMQNISIDQFFIKILSKINKIQNYRHDMVCRHWLINQCRHDIDWSRSLKLRWGIDRGWSWSVGIHDSSSWSAKVWIISTDRSGCAFYCGQRFISATETRLLFGHLHVAN